MAISNNVYLRKMCSYTKIWKVKKINAFPYMVLTALGICVAGSFITSIGHFHKNLLL